MMNDKRFLAIINQVISTMTPPLFDGASGVSEAERIRLWAEFLTQCVGKGVAVGDPRWRRLEIHRRGGKPRFKLPGSGPVREEEAREDFGVGLALLMGVLDSDD